MVKLTTEPIDPLRLQEHVLHASCGAIVTFDGVVRATVRGEDTLTALDYSGHEKMAIGLLEKIRTEAIKRFSVHDVAIVHRLGRINIGERSVAIAVSAPHREDAFAACRWIIDEIKADVPIWKKELWEKGQPTWVEPKPAPVDQQNERDIR